MPRKANKPQQPTAVKEAKIVNQPVDETLRLNYMPYAMSVIVSRALPNIDGFKPSHRKLLYTMYKMGLLTGARTKSANIVGQTMRLNPHGDQAIYETMVRLTRGNGALLKPFVDSKGNFGKVYSRDMAYAAARYTEAKLDPICSQIFGEISADAVDMEPNYDNTMKEPSMLPTTFPNILVSANQGIAVGMASSFPGFNFSEVCNATIAYLKNPKTDIMSIMPAPDFSTGGIIQLDKNEMADIYATGRGSFRVRSVWNYVKKENLVEITEIPYSTSVEAIIEKIADLMRAGKVPGISDVRDESDKSGMKIVIDLKRGADYASLMDYLTVNTPLEDAVSCNFNLLIDGKPKVLGVTQILDEWIAWRMATKERVLRHERAQLDARLHLLEGLSKILLNINKAIKIIRETEDDDEVVPNLMKGFKIDEAQAEFVAEIKLRNINKGYILKQTAAITDIQKQIADIDKLLSSKNGLKALIAKELAAIEKKYHAERISKIETATVITATEQKKPTNEKVSVLVSREGYVKKLSATEAAKQQKWRDEDETERTFEVKDSNEIIFLSQQAQAYKLRLSDIPFSTAASTGVYAGSLAEMSPGEQMIYLFIPDDKFSGHLAVGYENGKISVSKVSEFITKQNRRCLKNAYGSASAPVGAAYFPGKPGFVLVESSKGRKVAIPSSKVPVQGRGSQGVQALALRKNETMTLLRAAQDGEAEKYLPIKKKGG